jgi:dihydroxyacetone kinase
MGESIAMKKLINDPNRVVEQMLQGLVAIHPGLRRLAGETVLIRADAEEVPADTSRHTRALSVRGC